MSTITRERAEIKSYITGFLSDSAHDNKSSDSLLANVFRIALASLEEEPVAYQYRQWDAEYDEWEDCGEYAFEIFVEEEKCQGVGVQTRKLYTALPVPVVPDKLPREYIRGWPLAYSDYAEGWNDCREAMLQSGNFRENKNSSTSSPVTPDDWISCSERTSGKQVIELTMLVKQLVSQLKKSKPDCKLPDKAMGYLERNGLIGVEDVLR
ncbi:TPA: hypothetical protein SIF19_003142 [Escherichia coli]|nr:hypothetical protein [Escherichia coli]MBS9108109.1 hypothetical protein [Escherichia coli]MBS9199123.1 hypothetical protein [Escherichia coli]HCO6306142.1 hypothetical protein [Escherichia coli]HCO6315381.1 hypothetical protein [Escherichia coli]